MNESVSISRQPPELESMRYAHLREIGIARVQELAGKIWTDYNTHDPGVTILEALCYAITELGHRANLDIEDIIAPDPSDPDSADIKNFFTAARILPNNPLTLDDYRKLIIDVSVFDEADPGCDFVGVKNAWINPSGESEHPVWVHRAKNKLSYEKAVPEERIEISPLYDILLEFERCDTYGDLNQHIHADTMTVRDSGEGDLVGMEIIVEVEFARWDNPEVDWDTQESIRREIREIDLTFRNRPARYSLDFELDAENRVSLTGKRPDNSAFTPDTVTAALNAFLDEMIDLYQRKVFKIHEIVEEVHARLHSNRNLCEDFYRLRALKVELIAVCADIELELEADVEEVQAQILHRIATFLSPSITFRSLAEMREMDLPVEEIYEGPLLNHGFIPDDELRKAGRREKIHVSDLLQIVMNVQGVVAVKHIEIANIPQGNEENIPSKSVKWCLELAHEHNYVPRLSAADSKITFFKEQLPYQANRRAVNERVEELESESRSAKLKNPVVDLKIRPGRYLELDRYTSIQEEFPGAYGIGSTGLPATAGDQRRARARQLKGYLMFFDQLLANYLAQLSNVKDLFSMNAERDEKGRYRIGKTYYTQSLVDTVPHEDLLYMDLDQHPFNLDRIAESAELFVERRNKFLDHLMARFAEQFTDYATLTYLSAGMEGKRELIQDKLSFLNAYPEISSARGSAFNYRHPCMLWHIENRSGTEKRAALQVGIDEKQVDWLHFSNRVEITDSGGEFGFRVKDDDTVLLTQPSGVLFESRKEAAGAVEELIVNGVFRDRYSIEEESGEYSFVLMCGDRTAGVSERKDYSSPAEAETDLDILIMLFKEEFYGNPESNRNNYSAPIANYFEVQNGSSGAHFEIEYSLYSEPHEYEQEFELLSGVLEGDAVSEEVAESELEERTEEFIWDVVSNGGRRDRYSYFKDQDDDWRLKLVGRFGQELGVGTGKNYNDSVVAEFEALDPKTISIEDAASADGSYTFESATAEGPHVELSMTESMPVTGYGGRLSYTHSVPFFTHLQGNAFLIEGDFSSILYDVERVVIRDSGLNDGTYTVRKIGFESGNTVVGVEEQILEETAIGEGNLAYTRVFEIIEITTNTVRIVGGMDKKAAGDLAVFFYEKFMSSEGLHLVEHILLRPKINEQVFIDADENALGEPADPGAATFERRHTVRSAVRSQKKLRIDGDITKELATDLSITVEGTSNNDGTYTIRTFEYIPEKGWTAITVREAITETSTEPEGTIHYQITLPVTSVEPSLRKMVLDGGLEVLEHEIFEVAGSTEGLNDGRYKIESSSATASETEVIVGWKEQWIRDRLMPINLDPDCEHCQLANPYTYVATVALPYWQGRFSDMDFRRFFERKIRLEAPAHVLLKICWISNRQMVELEERYKKWLVENARVQQDKSALSSALHNLIDILDRLRNVYPVGRLHDCEEAETLEEAVILNNSILGSA